MRRWGHDAGSRCNASRQRWHRGHDGCGEPTDLLIKGKHVGAIGHDLEAPGAQVLDTTDCLVLPGVIDAHTHIALGTGVYKTPDDWLTGTRAAACGGVTTVVDFATQFPGQTLRQAVETRLAEAQDAAIDYALHVMVTDLPPSREHELADLELPCPFSSVGV